MQTNLIILQNKDKAKMNMKNQKQKIVKEQKFKQMREEKVKEILIAQEDFNLKKIEINLICKNFNQNKDLINNFSKLIKTNKMFQEKISIKINI